MPDQESDPATDIPTNPLLDKPVTEGRAANLMMLRGYVGRSFEAGTVSSPTGSWPWRSSHRPSRPS